MVWFIASAYFHAVNTLTMANSSYQCDDTECEIGKICPSSFQHNTVMNKYFLKFVFILIVYQNIQKLFWWVPIHLTLTVNNFNIIKSLNSNRQHFIKLYNNRKHYSNKYLIYSKNKMIGWGYFMIENVHYKQYHSKLANCICNGLENANNCIIWLTSKHYH